MPEKLSKAARAHLREQAEIEESFVEQARVRQRIAAGDAHGARTECMMRIAGRMEDERQLNGNGELWITERW
ncbi:hypothetical protein DIPPA_02581 [Diplonema papillatum]|nr:hypothetical protein DIPPA_02581 [Diplonema papillatum]